MSRWGLGIALAALAAVVLATACRSAEREEAGRPTPAEPAPTVPAPSPPPRDPDFYVPPEPLPPGDPGEVIRIEPISSPPGSRGWRVLYQSRSIDGEPVAVSGFVVAPEGAPPSGGYPILSWAHGNAGLADHCAPSRRIRDRLERVPLLQAWRQGWVVAATDYEGLGTPGVHPFLVGESEARGVLDVARAARRIEGLGASNRVAVAGHSQGGHAALFAGEVAPRYAPELDLLAVVAAAPAAELTRLAEDLHPLGFAVQAAVAFDEVYPRADLEDLLAEEAIGELDLVRQACAPEILGAFRDRDPGEVFRANPLGIEPWPRLLEANTPGNRTIPAPVLVVHGDRDEVIPAEVGQALVERLCRGSTAVQHRLYEGVDHAEVLPLAAPEVLRFLDDALKGRPLRMGC